MCVVKLWYVLCCPFFWEFKFSELSVLTSVNCDSYHNRVKALALPQTYRVPARFQIHFKKQTSGRGMDHSIHCKSRSVFKTKNLSIGQKSNIEVKKMTMKQKLSFSSFFIANSKVEIIYAQIC